MNRHLDDAALLEAYYLEDASGESAGHLETCTTCQRQLAEVVAMVRDESDGVEHPESFWQRQRLSIARRIATEQVQRPAWRRVLNVAAAAVIAFVLGGLLIFRGTATEPPKHVPVTQSVTASAAVEPQSLDLDVPKDPWESDELQTFGNVVEWESWVETNPAKGESL